MRATLRYGYRAPADRTAPAGPAHPTVILAIICTTYFMVILDNSIIFTGLPDIQSAMGFSDTGLSWVQNSYTLVFGGLLLLGARAGDLFGRRRVFLAGLGVFVMASFLVGAARSPGWLVAARALQGVGAAVIAPSALSLLTASFPEGRERTRAVAAYSAVAGIGASLGLVVGGVAADLVSWRAGFFLNVPIGAAMMVLAPRFLPGSDPRRGRFDAAGALLATVGSATLVLGIVESADHPWGSARVVLPLVVGVLALAAFVAVEGRVEQPIVPLRLFVSRERSGAYLIRMLYLGAMIGFFFYTTQFLQDVYGWSPLLAGLAFLPMTLPNFAVAVAIPRILARLDAAHVLTAGVALTAVGMTWLSRLDATTPYVVGVALPMVLLGLGQGLAFAPMTSSGMAQTTADDAGAASGLVNAVHQVGSALGLSILTTLAATAAPGDVTDRVRHALAGGSVLLAVAVVVVLALVVPARRSRAGRRTVRPARSQTPSRRRAP